ncbi:AAA family ATPase [Anaerobiospirillum succiniciproducens]|uniref:AAA family ATPase n=1 Tax=Anaerobiospirillum succiniciproducens TaxID=13335 RepID=UPI0029421C87|nr:AAA family ATPase [Anaerobiospirillum succiniciproducens]
MERRLITNGFFASFKQLISGNKIYVDKTKFACKLANDEGAFLLARPRRMGKSTMVSTLEYLFSKGTVGTEGLYCHENWPDPNRYFVFNFSFSRLDSSSVEALTYNFFRRLKVYADYFGVEIHQEDPIHQCFEYLVLQCVTKLSDKCFLAEHPELQEGERPLCTDKVVLLIDEYDAPLSYFLEEKEDPRELQYFYRHLFSTINKIDFRFVFITGVSSYKQGDIFGDPNLLIDISLDPRYATCCGYTQEELERYFAPELDHAQQQLMLSPDELMTKLSHYYSGYLFNGQESSNLDSQRVFNTVSISRFLIKPTSSFDNYWGQTGGGSRFLLQLIKLGSQKVREQVVAKLHPHVFDALDQNDPKVTECLDAWTPLCLFELSSYALPKSQEHMICTYAESLKVDLSTDELFNADNALATLYQAGYLAIQHVNSDKIYLGLANYDATKSLASVITDVRNYTNSSNYNLAALLSHLNELYKDAFEHHQHHGIADFGIYMQRLLNTLPEGVITIDNGHKLIAFFIYWLLNFQATQRGCAANLEVEQGKIIFYRPINADNTKLVEDIILEFKLSDSEDALSQLKSATEQLPATDSETTPAATAPHHYCVLISPQNKLVVAIEAKCADGSYKIVYRSDKLDDIAVNTSSS